VVIAEHVDGLRDVRLFGTPGQKQHGLDLVGIDRNGAYVVYQARRWKTFSPRDLRKTVEEYAGGRRPLDAKRFVVCVSSSARRTEYQEELARLRAAHDFEIDLYDQERLSGMLKDRGDLVRRLFGDEWERLFCGGEPLQPVTRSAADLLADAILRGPLEALGLDDVVARGQEVLASDPSQAAGLYGQVATALEGSEFAGFAGTFRQRQADASVQAGEANTAVRVLADLAWQDAEVGFGFRMHEAARWLEGLATKEDAAATIALMIDVFNAVERWYVDPFIELDEVASRIADLVFEAAPGAHAAALWLAESALASEQEDLLQRFLSMFDAVALERQKRTESDEVAVRLRLCMADATGEWDSLLGRTLRGRLGRRQAMLVHARHGRYLAWRSEPEAADKSYRLAIDQACQAGLNSEAAAALRSIWTVGVRYGLPDEDWFGAPELARAVQALGGEYLRTGYDRRGAGVSGLADGKLPAALKDLRAFLRSSAVSGQLASEIEAHSLLGKLYVRAGELGLATKHYVRAGDSTAVEEVLAGASTYVDCAQELQRNTPWERATALAALAAEGDLIPDDQVDALARTAFERSTGERQGLSAPWVWLSAHKLLAALGSRLPDDLAEQVLDLLEPLIAREPDQYRHNDKEHVQIVAALLLRYPEMRDRTGKHLLSLMAASPAVGQLTLKHGWDAIQSGSDALLDGLRALGSDGCEAALEALLFLEEDHPLLIEQARALMEKATNRPERKPGRYPVGSDLPRIAPFVRILPEEERVRFSEVAMATAGDASEMEVNRADALGAIRVVARSLPDDLRANLFRRIMSLAAAPGFSKFDEHLNAGLHPLSAFRFDLGFGSLVPQAVHTAAGLAQTRDEFEQIIGAASSLFRTGDEFATNQAAHALAQLPPEELTIDVRILAGSPIRWARQLAAVSWAARPDTAPTVGRDLATDPDSSVRRSLASSLGRLAETRPDLADELRELLSRDPSASVRSEVR
jgi:hypothetical protein